MTTGRPTDDNRSIGETQDDFTPDFCVSTGMCGDNGPLADAAWQSHVHEYLGSTQPAQSGSLSHCHRFAGITGEAVYVPGSHVHRMETKTDYHGHYHELRAITGPAVYVAGRDSADKYDTRHIHYVESRTLRIDGHRHEYAVGTLIESPMSAREC